MREWLNNVCIQLIDDGASEFFLGGYGAFDRLCADVLRGLKGRFRHIRLVLVLPYLDSALSREGYDETVYPPLESVPRRYAILRRNEWMVRRSDVIVAYVLHSWGGAAKTLDYARKKKKIILQYEECPIYQGSSEQGGEPLCSLLFFLCVSTLCRSLSE